MQRYQFVAYIIQLVKEKQILAVGNLYLNSSFIYLALYLLIIGLIGKECQMKDTDELKFPTD